MNWYVKAFKNYADFDGRARRKEFWMFFLYHSIFIYVAVSLSLLLHVPALLFAVTIYVFATVLPFCSLAVRRMHDNDKSGWYFLVPFYNMYLFCLNGEYAENQYGVSPKKREDVVLKKV